MSSNLITTAILVAAHVAWVLDAALVGRWRAAFAIFGLGLATFFSRLQIGELRRERDGLRAQLRRSA